ncbi:MAG: hypothetical protein HY959_07630 [Ignavibacteriae bacterium]|nr:hypothetical protein [Ignavibacteriota bacterium]
MKTGRDIKFVIYQVLYIFVVCVIALKGADINLEEVLNKENAVPKDVADAIKHKLDSLLALGLVPKMEWDSTKIYSKDDVDKLLAGLVPKTEENKNTGLIIEKQKDKEPDVNTNYTPPKSDKMATVQGVEFTQFTRPKLTNPYNENLEVFGDGKLLATIPPKGSSVINVNGESSFKFKVGNAEDVKSTKEKQSPKIDIQKFTTDGPNASLRKVQGGVGYRVTIISNYTGDLSVNINGPVKIDKVSSNQYDVTLVLLSSENAFNSWIKGKTEPYRTSFNVTVKDKYNPKLNVTEMKTFTFGEW